MKIRVETKKEISIDSPDHLCPVGCVNDNYSSLGLVGEVTDYFGGKQISVLDLGCAGGQFIAHFIGQDDIGIGLEGSSNVLNGSGKSNWKKYYNSNLFLCDITEEYQIYQNDIPLKFDYIHSEEVFEHISEDKIDIMLSQIKKHLKDDGICSFGISMVDDIRIVDEITYKLHQSVFPAEWWKNKLIENGFKIMNGGKNDENHFGYIFKNKVRDHGTDSCYFMCQHSV
jgi:SAM-dependent methyltransferase